MQMCCMGVISHHLPPPSSPPHAERLWRAACAAPSLSLALNTRMHNGACVSAPTRAPPLSSPFTAQHVHPPRSSAPPPTHPGSEEPHETLSILQPHPQGCSVTTHRSCYNSDPQCAPGQPALRACMPSFTRPASPFPYRCAWTPPRMRRTTHHAALLLFYCALFACAGAPSHYCRQ